MSSGNCSTSVLTTSSASCSYSLYSAMGVVNLVGRMWRVRPPLEHRLGPLQVKAPLLEELINDGRFVERRLLSFVCGQAFEAEEQNQRIQWLHPGL